MEKKAVIAMSGGVDSSVAAWLMKERGYDCIGVTMKLFSNETIDVSGEHTCCSLEDVRDAREVAERIGMEHYVFNFAEKFRQCVMERFVSAYERGATPNPCIDCNRYLKFEKLYQKARELGYEYVVTGHYARVAWDAEKGRYLLKKGLDPAKDQSYVLFSLTQEQLAHTILPLGELEKSQVREIAQKQGFINAQKQDSQDICFVPDGKYAQFIEAYRGKTFPEGDFVDQDGNVLGRHQGIIRYTMGQRKGIGLALQKPMYVCGIDTQKNQVVLGEQESLFHSSLDAKEINLISVERIVEPMRVKARVRYHQQEQWATVTQPTEDTLHLEFDEPQRAITKGQAVVMYDGDVVVGGGIIC